MLAAACSVHNGIVRNYRRVKCVYLMAAKHNHTYTTPYNDSTNHQLNCDEWWGDVDAGALLWEATTADRLHGFMDGSLVVGSTERVNWDEELDRAQRDETVVRILVRITHLYLLLKYFEILVCIITIFTIVIVF